MNAQRAICYLRVSTARQGSSGLGLEAQRAAVHAWAVATGHEIAGEFLEVESGKRDDRPELARALTSCRLHRATLVIAKLDRLARNVAFIANLMDSGTEFVAVDHPHANRLTIHIMAAMAEYEREQISQRTKAALAAAKARGVKLGNPNGAKHLRETCLDAAAVSARVRQRGATDRAAAVAPVIAEIQSQCTSNSGIARELNKRSVPSPAGGRWHAEQVRRTIARNAGTSPPS